MNPTDPNPYVVPVYAIYVAVSVGLTVFLARVLYTSGTTFLRDVFVEREHVADAVNKLLVVGFYMLNLGYAFLIMRTVESTTAGEAAETLVNRLGLLLVSLGAIHFVNMLVIWKVRRHEELGELPPPLAPQAYFPPPPAAPYAAEAADPTSADATW